MVPVWLSTKHFTDYPVYTLYSDDGGWGWHLGERVSENFDETAIARTSDDGVIVSSRQFSVPYNDARAMSKPQNASDARRRMARSATGIDGWSQTYAHPDLIDPGCEGSMTSRTMTDGRHVLLFVNNASVTDRKHLTVRTSLDDGKTWPYSLLIDEQRAVYSDVALSADGTVYVVHEDAPDEPLCHDLELFRFLLKI